MTTYTEWSNTIATYEREFKVWEGRTKKINDRYRDEKRQKETTGARFNILWSNVQTALPAVFSRLPKPDVSRRFGDNDPVGRVAALILERGLSFEVEHYPDYRATMNYCVLDRFLGGRGVAWIRYEPGQTPSVEPKQLAESSEEPPEKPQTLECAPSDYVYWKDFGHTVARNWQEVTAVWRKVYMGKEALVARFGEDIGNKIPLDTKPEKKESGGETRYEACIYEIWDLTSKNAIWLSKAMAQIIEEKPDPLQLEGFWPCPKPLFATITTDTLIPVPDYTLYQDQAETLNTLATRIEGLCQMLQVKGVYDAAEPALGRLLTEGENGTLIPIKNWAAFAEKQGLKGAFDVMELQPIYEALKAAYEAAEQQKNIIYEITGLADIIRGSTDPNETATAQKMKGNFGSMRLRAMQSTVAEFATEILQIKAQIICKYNPQTLAQIAGVQSFSQEDQQYIPEAMQLLANATLRDFRIEIVADSMIYMDELQEKSDRMEMATAVGNYLKSAIPAATETPQLAPLLMDLLKFIVTGFKVGKTIEGSFDTIADQLKQLAQNPQPKPNPEMEKIQAEAQAKQQQMQMDAQKSQQELQAKQQFEQWKAQLDAQVAQAQQAAQAQQDAQAQQMESQREQQKMQLQAQLDQHKASLDAQNKTLELAFNKWKAEQDNATKIAVAEIAAKATLDAAQLSAARAEASGGNVPSKPAPQTPQPQTPQPS
jgi:hypothetical protein